MSSVREGSRFRLLLFVALLLLPLVGLGAAAIRRVIRNPVGEAPAEGFEAMRAGAAYETSRACVPCHSNHERSWRKTFHRTMTQTASPKTIRGRFDGTPIDVLGVLSTPSEEGGELTLETSDPATGRPARFPIVRTVGSRRMEQYVTKQGDRYVRLPLAFSMEENRWLHLSEAFFHPDGEPFHQNTAVWDLNCIFCHNVKAKPGLAKDGSLASEVAELGIACEACHGPGEEHARRMRSPLRRYAFSFGFPVDPTIVNPSRVEKKRSVEICAHCHGQRLPADPSKIMEIYRNGDPYTPGEDLGRHFTPIDRDTKVGSFEFAPRFWKDGSPRLTAYEYQGLLRSKCFLDGEMTCLSCHSMHTGDPHGQMRPDLPGNTICSQCHGNLGGARLAEHTKHRAESTGSQCVACHMPPVVYGIMTWHPTHEIRSPDPAQSARFAKPDACTLCHTGRAISWAAEKTGEMWPKGRRPELKLASRFEAPEIPRALFSGDVVYRTLAAWRLGESSPEPEVSAAAVPLLAESLLDSYPNVRRTARNSLARLTGRDDLPLALEPAEKRREARDLLVTSRVSFQGLAQLGWPFGPDGLIDQKTLAEWKNEREEIPVSIGE